MRQVLWAFRMLTMIKEEYDIICIGTNHHRHHLSVLVVCIGVRVNKGSNDYRDGENGFL